MKFLLRRRPAAWLSILLLTPLGVAGASDQDIESAMQNPFLRERFRDREETLLYGPVFRRARRFDRAPWEREENDFMLERRVDQLIRLYLTSLLEKKAALEESLREVRAAKAEEAPWADSAAFAAAMEILKDRADDVRSSLSTVITDLPKKAEYQPSVGPESASTGFREEIAFIEKEAESALKGIDSFFFSPGGTVTVASLQGDDMMQSLHRVALMAEALAAAAR